MINSFPLLVYLNLPKYILQFYLQVLLFDEEKTKIEIFLTHDPVLNVHNNLMIDTKVLHRSTFQVHRGFSS